MWVASKGELQADERSVAGEVGDPTRITVHTMGAHYRWQVPDVLRQQLRLAHDLREDLVSLQLAYDEDIKTIWSSYPSVATAEVQVAAAEERVECVAAAMKAARITARDKLVDSPLAQQLREAKAALRSARQLRRDAITNVKDAAAQRRRDRSAQLAAEQKSLYCRYCQSPTGHQLFWATFNYIVDQHKVAVRRIQQQRAQHKPATLRHHRFDGTGTIAVQLQRTAGRPPRTPLVVADPAGRYHNVLYMPWIRPQQWEDMSRAEKRRAGRITVRLRCGSIDSQPQWIDVPVQAHRWLPAEADIVGAKLTLARVGADLRAQLSITARIPDPIVAQHSDRPTVAIHLGWQACDSGTVVAHWRATKPLTIPRQLAHVIVPISDGVSGRIIAPALIATRLQRLSHTASTRDLALDSIRGKLTDWLDEHGPIPHPTRPNEQLTAAAVVQWRSPSRFAALALDWRDSGTEMSTQLEAWRRSDRLRWQQHGHGLSRARGYRDDLWRQVAHTLASQCGRIVVDDTNVTDVTRGALERSTLPTDRQREIDRRREYAAPGRLRQAIIAAATREAVPVTVVPAAGLSRIHSSCGHENPAELQPRKGVLTCRGCGRTYDPDLSATILMLQRAR